MRCTRRAGRQVPTRSGSCGRDSPSSASASPMLSGATGSARCAWSAGLAGDWRRIPPPVGRIRLRPQPHHRMDPKPGKRTGRQLLAHRSAAISSRLVRCDQGGVRCGLVATRDMGSSQLPALRRWFGCAITVIMLIELGACAVADHPPSVAAGTADNSPTVVPGPRKAREQRIQSRRSAQGRRFPRPRRAQRPYSPSPRRIPADRSLQLLRSQAESCRRITS